MSGTFYFQGTARWAKVHKPDSKYNKYSVDLYMDEPSWSSFRKSGLQLKVREDDNGKFVKFSLAASRLVKDEVIKAKPEVYDADNNPMTKDIGNGSKVTIKVEVFDTANGPGHRLVAIRADELVEYDDPKKVSDDSIEVETPF